MTNVIRIKNASFYAYHGALQEEQNIGGRFEADVDIYTDFSEAAEKDDLKLTINYDEVYKFINKIVHTKKYYLIETLATVIADGILENFSGIKKICVRVRKNNVPVGGVIDCVEAEVEKESGE
ncbi:MAG: dihydroneopterin aldolase [Bacteroidetes bacterium]|nr:dihydroneopterin aldolase [Bacteroidota bacterium]MBU1680652.1 dihydroneopterin aldolase [Bacteroidota bacterium]MBU2506519.1 dihydroneopterin aldolase [Bacteroidota bacterium]